MSNRELDSIAFRRRGGNLVATGAFENWLPFLALARAHQTAALRTELHLGLDPRKCGVNLLEGASLALLKLSNTGSKPTRASMHPEWLAQVEYW